MSEKILSVFIDESGDFGPYEAHAPCYLVSMILHNQNIDISENITVFDAHLSNLGYQHHAIHTGPLIRRESVYSNDLVEEKNTYSMPYSTLHVDSILSIPASR
ncbi:MAG: hypothetical protein HDR06_04310 [Lachnospiraceae bacterium]|nr:hypothetical protein [Lachnospiraceae bacterium]